MSAGCLPRRRSAASARASGIVDLFGGSGEPTRLFFVAAEPWPPAERLQREFAAIGTYLSAHPIDDYATLAEMRGGLTWKAFLDQLRARPPVHRRRSRRPWSAGRSGARAPAGGSASSCSPIRRRSSRRPSTRSGSPNGASCLSPAIRSSCRSAASSIRRRRRCARASRRSSRSRRWRRKKAQAIRVFLDAPEPIERLASRLEQGRGDGLRHRHARRPRGGGEAPRPVPRHPAGRRRHQGGAGRRARGDGVAERASSVVCRRSAARGRRRELAPVAKSKDDAPSAGRASCGSGMRGDTSGPRSGTPRRRRPACRRQTACPPSRRRPSAPV